MMAGLFSHVVTGFFLQNLCIMQRASSTAHYIHIRLCT